MQSLLLLAGGAIIGLIGLFGSFLPMQDRVDVLENELQLGASQQFFGGFSYTLAGSGISSSATSIVLTSLTIPQTGQPVQDSDLGDTFYVTVEPGNTSRQEFVSCTTVTQGATSATLSGCTRGLSPVSPYTASSTLRFAHAGGTKLIFSNPPQLYDQAAFKANNETITGQWTFSTFPITPNNGTSTLTVAGVVELATGAQAASSTVTDTTGANLALHTGISTSTSGQSSGAPVVVMAQQDGTIDYNFLPSTIAKSLIFTGSTIFSSGVSILYNNPNAATSTPSTATTTLVSVTIPSGTLDASTKSLEFNGMWAGSGSKCNASIGIGNGLSTTTVGMATTQSDSTKFYLTTVSGFAYASSTGSTAKLNVFTKGEWSTETPGIFSESASHTLFAGNSLTVDMTGNLYLGFQGAVTSVGDRCMFIGGTVKVIDS